MGLVQAGLERRIAQIEEKSFLDLACDILGMHPSSCLIRDDSESNAIVSVTPAYQANSEGVYTTVILPQYRHSLFFATDTLAEEASTWVQNHIDLTSYYQVVDCSVIDNAALPECSFLTTERLSQDLVDVILRACQPKTAEFHLPLPVAGKPLLSSSTMSFPGMRVLVVRTVEEPAKQWLLSYGAAFEVESVHRLLLVFLPLRIFRVQPARLPGEPQRIYLLPALREYARFNDQADSFQATIFLPTA